MTSDIDVRSMAPRRILAKKTTCPHSEIGPAFGRAMQTVGACVHASGATMASMPMTVYLAWRESDCDMAAGCEVTGNVTLSDGCEWVDVPSGPHAVASHFGPYDTLHETHSAIQKWCRENGRRLSGQCWETYPTDPGREPDASRWQTDVHYPVGE